MRTADKAWSTARWAGAVGILTGLLMADPGLGAAQTPVARIMTQDSTLDNLSSPAGAATARLGTLGGVIRRGAGPGRMLLIPGFGFGGAVFEPLVDTLASRYTTWSVTLPGFGGTDPPPAPPATTSFGDQTWMGGALEGIGELLVREDIRDVVVVGHWLGGTQLAVRLAARYPDRVRAVVLLAGSARLTVPGRPAMTVAQRVTYMDRAMGPGWFKTVTRETWDDNNFLPGDYAVHPVMGLRLWRQAATPHLHTWVRYLCEFYAQDITTELHGVRVPMLLLHPDVASISNPPDLNYMPGFTSGSWGDVSAFNLKQVTVAGTRVVMWADRLDAVVGAIDSFVGSPPTR